MSRQDAAFYTDSHDAEILWRPEGDNPRNVRVYRNGEMRIHYTEPSGEVSVLRYTQDLDEKGLDTDEKLFEAGEHGKIEWINNAWFEVAWIDNEDGEIVDGIDEAIEYAKRIYNGEEDGAAGDYRPPCDCDQSGSGFYLCSYCFAEQVGGE